MTEYYDWNKTLSYNADVTMVIGARGIGKTFGLRMQFIRDYINKGYRFFELVRYKNELVDATTGYFEKLASFFPEYVFKSSKRFGYIAKKPEEYDGNERKLVWDKICYFGAMTEEQAIKKRSNSYVNCANILFDEAVIDKRLDVYHNYLPNEYGILVSIVDSVTRERKDDNRKRKPKVFLLGNACDLMNVYFAAYNINKVPEYGYSWHKGKTMILHYVKDEIYSEEKTKHTVAGRMLEGTVDERISSGNEFIGFTNEFVKEKPKNAKFMFGLIYNNNRYGIWADYQCGYYHVTGKIPNNSTNVYTLTVEDSRVNYIMAKKATPILRSFFDLYYYGIIRYESPEIKARFNEVLAAFGIK